MVFRRSFAISQKIAYICIPFYADFNQKIKQPMKVCEITGKVAIVGNNVSHSHHKTKRKFSPNLKTKRFWSEQEGRWITLKVTAAGMKTINKKGLEVALREAAAPKTVY
jgi:large subunit ribosomal protein L28